MGGGEGKHKINMGHCEKVKQEEAPEVEAASRAEKVFEQTTPEIFPKTVERH